MIKIKGKPVNNLVTSGPVKVIRKNSEPGKRIIEDISKEIVLLEESIEKAKNQLKEIYESTLATKGEDMAAIIEVQIMMLEDDEFIDAIKDNIESEKVCASYAAYITGNTFAAMFAEMEDEYFRARSADILDISRRIVRVLTGQKEEEFFDSKVIIVAEDLGPSETIRLDKDSVLAFVTLLGSVNSHTAILARTMNIPALVSTDFDMDALVDGTMAIVDGNEGLFIIDPEQHELEKALSIIEAQKRDADELGQLKGLETITKSGRKVKLFANIGSPEDADLVLEEDGEGIGLFRSEFLYIGRDSAPTEEEQYQAYKAVLEKMGDRPVIIRTLDIGADKQADYLNLPKEDNPAMGLRAIRICLTNKELFKTQLRALLRAAVHGNMLIMYPMIISEKEIDEIQLVVREAEEELRSESKEYRIPSQGIMIETPASVIMSESLAKKVDFFSIGTNDLTQYTLAIDRQNQSLDRFFDPHHPAVLEMIRMVAENAHKAGIWTGICGELAADTSLTETFIEMGIDELSVAPKSILKLRKAIRNLE